MNPVNSVQNLFTKQLPPVNFDELKSLYDLPFFDLLQKAREVHEANWPKDEVQLCTLLSIKTGGCSEDCSYCAQSARYDSGVDAGRLMPKCDIVDRAKVARESGSTRFCMGAAWKGVKAGSSRFDEVLDIVRDVSELGLEVCTTLGSLGADEAKALKEAGVTAYNHNIDTSPENYTNIVTTHSFQDRLDTIRHVQDAGMSVCSGGILGLGETVDDRPRMLEVLAGFNPPPESVPINKLMPMPGTPLDGADPVDTFDLVRTIACARIAVPKSKVRLSAGRTELSEEAQALCFFAGANSIFYGDKLLTAANPQTEQDLKLLEKLGMRPQPPKRDQPAPAPEADRPLEPQLA